MGAGATSGAGLGVLQRARRAVGPVVRRTRREVQWRRPAYRLTTAPAEAFPHVAIEHATPLIRELAGLDLRLQHTKVTNLRLAAAALDGVVLRPGGRLSFWRQVGPPTASRGFAEGLVLRQGELGAGVGGGLCQATNMIYWLTLHTPLAVTERWRHSFDVFPDAGRTQPFASGATCAWPALDLQVANPARVAFRLGMTVTDTHLVGRWTTTAPLAQIYEVYEVDHRITRDPDGGHTRSNEMRRRVLRDGVVVGDELISRNVARVMYPVDDVDVTTD